MLRWLCCTLSPRQPGLKLQLPCYSRCLRDNVRTLLVAIAMGGVDEYQEVVRCWCGTLLGIGMA
jgi:hypothetical protein